MYLISISFPEPTCLLSSGIINFHNYDDWLINLSNCSCVNSLQTQTYFQLSLGSAERNCFRRNQVTAGNTSAFARVMRKLPEVKLLVNKSEQLRAGEREFQTNMAQKTPTKLVNTKICRCCCKPLCSNDHPILLFGEKSQREVIKGGYNEIIGHVVNQGTHAS